LLMTTIFSVGGCAIITHSSDQLTSDSDSTLPPIAEVPGAIELQIFQVRRVVNDPLIVDELWHEVNQVTAGGDDGWQRMSRNGFRIGVASAHPPDSLIKLLQTENDSPGAMAEPQQLKPQRIMVRENTRTEINASPYFAHCKINVPNGAEAEVLEFESARGQFLLTAKKTQDGWVELELVPLVKHGNAKMRPVPTTGGGFGYQDGQLRKTFHRDRFNVKLMVGDWVVIGGDPERTGTLGHQFYFGPEGDDAELQAFRRLHKERAENNSEDASGISEDEQPAEIPSTDPQFQRLLILRIAGMQSAIVH